MRSDELSVIGAWVLVGFWWGGQVKQRSMMISKFIFFFFENHIYLYTLFGS